MSYDPAWASAAQLLQVYEAALLVDSNVSLTGEQTLDGVLTSASRVLLVGQTDASENGCYVTAAGAWARAVELDSDADLAAHLAQDIHYLIGTGGTEYGLGGLGGLRYHIAYNEGATTLDTDDVVFEVAQSRTLIAIDEFSSAKASVTVSNIPPCFRHLEVRLVGRGTEAILGAEMLLEYNGDTTAGNYRHAVLFGGAGTGSAATSDRTFGTLPGASGDANYRGALLARIMDYTGPLFKSAIVAEAGTRATAQVYVFNTATIWLNTAVVTSLKVSAKSLNIDQDSLLEVYGVM